MRRHASQSSQESSERVGLLAKNSFANVIRAVSTSALSIITPLVLVITLPPAEYRAWVLVFGVAAYVAYFDLGLQATVQALVGQLLGQGRHISARSVVWNALGILGVLCTVLLAGAVLVALNAHLLFPAMDASLVASFRTSLLIVTLGQCATLAANVLTGFYMAYHRTLEPTIVLTFSRLGALAGISVLGLVTHDLVWLSLSFSAPLVVGLLYLLAKLRREKIAPSGFPIDESSIRVWDLLKFSGPMALWGVCMLMVSGAGVVIIGRLQYEAVAAYSIAMMMVAAVVGLANALVGPLLSELSRMHGSGKDVLAALPFALRANSLLVLFLGAGSLIAYPAIVRILPSYVQDHLSLGVLGLLVCGNVLRLTMTPLSLLFVATGSHKRILLPPIFEALVNVTLSYALGALFGLLGLGWGVLAGSLMGVLLASTWSVKLSQISGLLTSDVAVVGLLVPMACVAPTVIAVFIVDVLAPATWLGLAVMICSLVGSILLAWNIGLKAPEKLYLRKFTRRLLQLM